jgi:S1-C subfamily serine protease
VLKVDCGQLHALPLGDSRSVQVGDDVFAVGNPFGLDGSFSRGIISARGRSNINIHGILYQNFLQTDAVINPGNSGGPLVNLRGEVVGVNTAIATQTGHYDGVGFAIPAWRLSELLPQLVRGGEIVRGYLGVEIVSTIGRDATTFELDGERVDGVEVSRVVADAPAARAGLLAGDLIMAVNDVRLSDTDELIDLVAATAPGTVIPVELLRDGERLMLAVSVGRQPPGFRPRSPVGRED